MRARWASFSVGLWLVLAPLLLGDLSVGHVLHDVTLGLLVSVGALASLEWPAVRFALAVPAIWLVLSRGAMGWTARTATNDVACGAPAGSKGTADVAATKNSNLHQVVLSTGRPGWPRRERRAQSRLGLQ